MKHRGLLVGAIGLLLVGAAGLVITLLLMSGSRAAFVPGPQAGRSDIVDAMFIERMIPHHQDAIDMAEMAASRAEHPEIRDLAKRIERSQSAENEQMREWYREWFDSEVPDRPFGMGGRGMMGSSEADLDRLRDAEDFDRAFIEQMVPHHRMGIMMAQMAARSTGRPEMLDLTETIIETQSSEIEDMERWYDEWYGR